MCESSFSICRGDESGDQQLLKSRIDLALFERLGVLRKREKGELYMLGCRARVERNASGSEKASKGAGKVGAVFGIGRRTGAFLRLHSPWALNDGALPRGL